MCVTRQKRFKITARSILFSTVISLKHKLCGSAVFGLGRHYSPSQARLWWSKYSPCLMECLMSVGATLCFPAAARQLTLPEKFTLFCWSAFSRLSWALSSALRCLSPLVSLFSIVSYHCSLHHPQGPDTLLLLPLLADGIASYFTQKAGEDSLTLLQCRQHLLLVSPATPEFYISGGDDTIHPSHQASKKGMNHLHPSPVLSQSPTLFQPLPNTSPICLIIPANTDLWRPYHLSENDCNSFLDGPASGFFLPPNKGFLTDSKSDVYRPCFDIPVSWRTG